MIERLGELRRDLVSQRHQRMVLRANLAALTLAVSVIAAELSALATGLVANHRTAVAVLFAASSGSALLAILAAQRQLGREDAAKRLVGKTCELAIVAASVLGLIGAFVAAWPD